MRNNKTNLETEICKKVLIHWVFAIIISTIIFYLVADVLLDAASLCNYFGNLIFVSAAYLTSYFTFRVMPQNYKKDEWIEICLAVIALCLNMMLTIISNL